MVTLRIPVPSSAMVVNLLGVVSVAAIIAAIAILTAWPWALLAAGVFGLALTLVAQNAAPAESDNVRPIAGHWRKAGG